MVTFSEKLAQALRKYLAEQGMRVVEWWDNHGFLWLHSFIFILEFYPGKLDVFLPTDEFPLVL